MKDKGDPHFIPPGPLFAKRLARTTDPDTSHDAAKALVESGRMTKRQGELVHMVERFPGRTARELQDWYRGKGELWKRVDECVNRGLIRRGTPRQCRESGREAATLWPISDK